MGRFLSKLPIDVHLGKFLLIATLFRCLDPALTIAAALNSKSPFMRPFGWEREADAAKAVFVTGGSDFLTLHKAYSSWRENARGRGQGQDFCRQKFLSYQNLQQIEELRQQLLSYLLDAGALTPNEDLSRQLTRAKYIRNRTTFVDIPAEYNTAENANIVNAALCAGLYPKILVADKGDERSTKRHGPTLKTLTNNQVASLHPSSVNFHKAPLDPALGIRHLSYYTLMHSKKLYAWETGPVDDLALILLCGQSDIKLLSESFVIDRKIKYKILPTTSLALKYLRKNFKINIDTLLKGATLTPTQEKWNNTLLRVLSRVSEEAVSKVKADIRVSS